jgi:abhydrolase domain-containing protein 6
MSLLERVQDWMLDKGMEGEINKARLTREAVQLSFGVIHYLYRAASSRAHSDAVLMLHGATADNTTWIRFCGQLKSDVALYAPDLPGHGQSVAGLSLSYTIGAQVERIVEMLGALKIARVHIVASSMGAAIALQLAARQPELVASLVLIGAVGVQAEPGWLQQHIASTGQNPMVEVRSKNDYVAMVRIGMSRPPYMPGFVLSTLARKYQARLPVNVKIGNDIAADLDQSALLPRVLCPVLIIWGRDDKVSHVSNAGLLRSSLRAAELHIFDGIGHVPMVEAPREVAALCDTFLARVRQPA